jgi:hypothetical protein
MIQKTEVVLSFAIGYLCLWFVMTLLHHLKAGFELSEPLLTFAIERNSRFVRDKNGVNPVSSVQASLPIEVPETKNAIVEMHVTDARGGRTSHLQADGEFVVGTPNKL